MSSDLHYYHIQGSNGSPVRISELAIEQSKTLSDLISNLGSDGEIPINNISFETLQKVVVWCEHHKGSSIPTDEESDPKIVEIPEWDLEFLNVPHSELYDLILASNYLDIKALFNYSCKKASLLAKGKTKEEMRAIFGILEDEEAEIGADATK